MAAKEPEPSLMRNLGAFFGHIVQAIKEDPAERVSDETAAAGAEKGEQRASESSDTLEVRREIQEARHGPYLLRRTTIDEVIRAPEGEAGPTDEQPRGDDRPRD
jgi:hypothetical protein